MRARRAMTLVELLVALAVFGVVLAIAYGAIAGALRVHVDQEAATSTQARLRRVVEVVAQDVRSAVFGGLVASPYPSDEDSVSFLLLSGGTGHPVVPHDGGQGTSFPHANNVQILAALDGDVATFDDREVVLVNANGDAVVLTITNATERGNGTWNLVHAGCANTIDYTPGTMLFEVTTHGLAHDPSTGELLYRAAGGEEAPLAFGIDGLRFEYVYVSATAPERTRRRATPALVNGVPVRVLVEDGHRWLLSRIRVVLEAVEASGAGEVRRTVAGQIDLSGSERVPVREVTVCDGA